MITHLKTIVFCLSIFSLICLIVMFPKVVICTLSIIACMVFYYVIYRSFKEGEKEYENLGPHNNGGRDLD